MKLFYTLLPFYTTAMLLILLMPVRINIFYQRENKNDFMSIHLSTFFSLLHLKVEIPILQQETPMDLTWEAELKTGQDKLLREEKDKISALEIDWRKVRRFFHWMRKNRQFLKYISHYYLQAMTVEKVSLKVRGGLDDAALTGVMTGFFWSLAGIIKNSMLRRLRLQKKPVIILQPDFGEEPEFKLDFDTAVSFRIGHFLLGNMLFLSTIIRGGNN